MCATHLCPFAIILPFSIQMPKAVFKILHSSFSQLWIAEGEICVRKVWGADFEELKWTMADDDEFYESGKWRPKGNEKERKGKWKWRAEEILIGIGENCSRAHFILSVWIGGCLSACRTMGKWKMCPQWWIWWRNQEREIRERGVVNSQPGRIRMSTGSNWARHSPIKPKTFTYSSNQPIYFSFTHFPFIAKWALFPNQTVELRHTNLWPMRPSHSRLWPSFL